MQYGIYYNTDTLHLQGALIHTALYADTTYIYNKSTGRLQYRYITGRPNTYGTVRRPNLHLQYRYSTFTGRPNTYVSSHFHTCTY